MDWGKTNRLNALIKPDGHCFFLPIDHGYFQGPTTCLERPYETIRPIVRHADALFVTRGVLRAAIPPELGTPIILRVSGGTSMVGGDLADEVLTTSIDDILRLNVSAVGVSVFVGTDFQRQTLGNLCEMVNRCEPYGIPVMAVTAVGREMEKRDARYLGLACRICAELGATVVKTYWCQDFDKVVNGCPVPVVIAGGPQCETEIEVFRFVYDGMQKGAIGINLGRNVWKHPHPLAMMQALVAMVHRKATPEGAQRVFEEVRKRQEARAKQAD